MTDIKQIQAHVLKKLSEGLPSHLSYHNVNHTLDVQKQAMMIAKEEGIDAPEDLLILELSTLYHDVGFIWVYEGHEAKSCEVASAELSGFGYSPSQIEIICSMIMATRIPQSPKNILENIICDADLDYLGRSDFYSIGDGLFKEFLHQGVVHNDEEWNRLQVRFLEGHHYFTRSCIQKREQIKQQHLQEVKMKVAVI
jgi:uncharacterized protein